MKRFIILAAVSAMVIARPETYKEQEDFQFSRSSSDDGTKSGYYGAQRGNMGGNYERAHNMDTLAQHQMSGLVRQVNGDLGDGAKTRAGSVFSAANSRGTYGSGNFDLSNLEGRNFQEGTSSGNSQLRSTLTHSSSAHNSAGYASSSSQNYGSNRKIASDAQTQTDNLQSLDNLQASNQHNYGSSQRSSGYQSQAGFQEQSQYNSGSTNSNSGYGTTQYTRYTPVRIIVRPGGRVAIPVATQAYDATQGSSVFNHNALTSEDELTGDISQSSVNRPSNTKHYESSYRYNKKWEKHDSIPTVSVVAPTESPIPKNSELYEDLDVHRSNYQNNARGADTQNTHLSSASGRYNAAQIASQSRYQSNYNSQQTSDDTNSNAYTHSGHNSHLNHGVSSDSSNAYSQAQRNSGSRYYGVAADSSLNTQTGHTADSQLDLNGQVEGFNTRPKSYQTSYAYHKSWERQGDPYVIKPASSGYYDTTSQRLTSSTKNLGYNTYQPSSNYRSCDENCHIRVARSHGTDNQDIEQQQSQNLYDDQHLSQQVQGTWTNLADLNQQSQNTWDQQNVGQESHSNWDNLKDLSQQSQTNWDQQNVGQQSQNHWDKLEDLGQQAQSNWDQQNVEQQSQNHWDHLENLGQQGKQDQQNVAQQTENQGSNLQNLNQQSQVNWDQQNVGQQSQNNWDHLEDLGQKSQNNWDQLNVGQQTQNQEKNLENLDQQSQSNWDQLNVGQQSNSNWDKTEKLNDPSLNWGKLEDLGQQSVNQNTWDKSEDIRQNSQKPDDLEFLGQQAQNNQDNKRQDNLYAQYEHKLEVIRPDIHLGNSQSSNEKESDKKVEIPWDKFDNFDSENTKITIDQEDNTDQKIATSYADADVLPHQVLQSDKVNFNNNDGILPRQNDSNDYGYSSGFVNPFLNQNHNNQLSNNENTYAANSADFESSVWNSHIHSNSHSQVNWQRFNNSHINIQQTPLTSLWSKFDKLDTGSGLSTYINHANKNFTSLVVNQNNTVSENQPWYVRDVTDKLKNNTESNTPSVTQEYSKNINTTLNSDKPETPQDIGRGDIGPEDTIDIDASDKPYNNPISTPPISPNTVNNPTKYDNAKPIIEIINSDIEQEMPDDQLTVLSLEQQRDDNNTVVSYKNYTTHNILQNDRKQIKKEYNNTDLQSHNKIENQSHRDDQTQYFGIQTDTLTDKNTRYQNYSNQDIDVQMQNSAHFEQQSVNTEQENTYNLGQDSHFFTQRNEKQEQQQDLHNFHETLRNGNLEQQNLHDFGQEHQQKELHKFHETLRNGNLEQQNLHDFRQEQQQQDLHNFHETLRNGNLEQQNLDDFGQEQQQQELHNFHETLRNGNPEQPNLHDFSEEQQQQDLHNFHETLRNGNLEKQNLHNFGQEQQQQDLHNFHETLQNGNLDQQNLHDFGQEQVLNAGQEDRNVEQKTFGKENMLILSNQNNNLNQQNESPFRQENIPEMGKENENSYQQYYKQKHNDTTKIETQINVALVNNQNDNVNQTNLPRVQKSVRGSNLDKNEDNFIQSYGQQDQFEKNYASDYESGIHSYEQEFDQDFNMQYQSYSRNSHNFGQQSVEQHKQNIQAQEPTTTTTTITLITIEKANNSSDAKISHPVTPKPGFWKSVGSKMTSAKDKIASWFKGSILNK